MNVKVNTLLVRALAELADAELAYRNLYIKHGDGGGRVVGEAWDRLTRAGDHAREILELARVRVT